jgi:hypothetical protein
VVERGVLRLTFYPCPLRCPFLPSPPVPRPWYGVLHCTYLKYYLTERWDDSCSLLCPVTVMLLCPPSFSLTTSYSFFWFSRLAFALGTAFLFGFLPSGPACLVTLLCLLSVPQQLETAHLSLVTPALSHHQLRSKNRISGTLFVMARQPLAC